MEGLGFIIFLFGLIWSGHAAIRNPTATVSKDQPQYLRSQPRSSIDDPSAYTFSHEGFTQQRVVTGCEGQRSSSGELTMDYYIIDASGVKKYVNPGSSMKVAYPGPGLFPGFTRTSTVYFHEMCFPRKCGSATCGYAFGPISNEADSPNQPEKLYISSVPAPSTALETVPNSQDERFFFDCWTSNKPCFKPKPTLPPTTTTTTPIPTVPAPISCCPPVVVNPCKPLCIPPTPPPTTTTTTTTTTPKPPPACVPCVPVTTTTTPAPTPAPCVPCVPVTTPAPTPAPITCPPPPPACTPITPPSCSPPRTKRGQDEISTSVKDAAYYARLPGAIRGHTGVIYYPSCEKDAFQQVAIVPFCEAHKSSRSLPFPFSAVSSKSIQVPVKGGVIDSPAQPVEQSASDAEKRSESIIQVDSSQDKPKASVPQVKSLETEVISKSEEPKVAVSESKGTSQ